MKEEKKGVSILETDKNKSFNSSFIKSNDFKLLISGAVILLAIRSIFQAIIHFAVNGGYSLEGVWLFLFTLSFIVKVNTLFLIVDYSIITSAMIFILSFVSSAKGINNVGKLAVILFFGTGLCFFISDFLYKSDMDLLSLNLLVFKIAVMVILFFLSFVALIGILTEGKNVEAETTKIRTLRELINFCLQSKSFRLLLSLLLWLLALCAVLVKLINLLPKLELMGAYELLTYLVVSVVSSILIFAGVLFATRKVKKSLFSMVRLVAMTIVFYSFYLFILLFFLRLSID